MMEGWKDALERYRYVATIACPTSYNVHGPESLRYRDLFLSRSLKSPFIGQYYSYHQRFPPPLVLREGPLSWVSSF